MLNEKSLEERDFMRDLTFKNERKFDRYWATVTN